MGAWRGAVRCLATAVLALLAARAAPAQPIAVAAASDLQSALPPIASSFERDTGLKVQLTFGSSGNFFAQIQNGAPFDLFLSADIDYPRRLDAAGLAKHGSLFQYATGRLVLWARKDAGIDLSRGLGAVADARVRRIAVANPEHAPYGRAAIDALRHEGLYDRVKDKLVMGENVSQAAQFAQSGAADVGLIALALARSPALEAAGTSVDVAAGSYPPIAQGAVVLESSPRKAAAQRFVDYLQTPAARKMLEAYGFDVAK
jgi:molybdate transport system substrate-binding protein